MDMSYNRRSFNKGSGDFMPREKTYNTKGRALILDYLVMHSDQAVSVQEIYDALGASNINISTIYRYLDKLVKEGVVLKSVSHNGEMATFQFIEKEKRCHEHLHMKCIHCGRVNHLDCAFMEDLRGHVLKHHGFRIECQNSLLYGVCGACEKLEQHRNKTD